MTDSPFSVFDPGYGMLPEFAALARQSGRVLNAHSHAQIAGAGNLLAKAMQALASGDPQRAEGLIERAAQMPYDEREEGSPGVRAASMLVYVRIDDRFEASEEDDTTWIEVAVQVHAGLDRVGQASVASVVNGFARQSMLFDLTAGEKKRIKHAFGDAPLNADLGDVPETTVEQRHAIIRSLVLAAVALEDAYAAAAEVARP